MIFPAAMNIYTGAELLKNMDPKWRELQRKEFSVIGEARAKEYGASGLSVDFVLGYELGLATARAMLAGSAELILKGVNPEEVL